MSRYLIVIAAVLCYLLSNTEVNAQVYAGVTCTFAPPQAPTGTSRSNTCSFPDFAQPDGGGIAATDFRNAQLTIIEEHTATGIRTNYVTTWDFYNHTEDDKHKAAIAVDVFLFDASGQQLDVIHGSSERSFCSYNGNWASGSIPATTSSNNYIDQIRSAQVRTTYNASYEGGC